MFTLHSAKSSVRSIKDTTNIPNIDAGQMSSLVSI